MYIKCTPTCNNHCYQCQNFWLWPFLSFYLLLLIILIILQVVDQMLTGTLRWISGLCLYSLLCFCSWWNELSSSFLYVSESYFFIQSCFVCTIDKLFVLSLCLCQFLHYVFYKWFITFFVTVFQNKWKKCVNQETLVFSHVWQDTSFLNLTVFQNNQYGKVAFWGVV